MASGIFTNTFTFLLKSWCEETNGNSCWLSFCWASLVMGTFRVFSHETERKGMRDIGHGKLEQCVHEVLQGIDSDVVGEENTCFEVILNCNKAVIWLEVRCPEKKTICVVKSECWRPECRFFLLILTSISTFIGCSKSWAKNGKNFHKLTPFKYKNYLNIWQSLVVNVKYPPLIPVRQ